MKRRAKVSIIHYSAFFIISLFYACEPDSPAPINAFPANKVTSVYIDKPGIIWACTDSGLVSFKNNNWKLSGDPAFRNVNDITSQITDLSSYLWLATNSGAIRAESKNSSLLSQIFYNRESSGLIDNRISVILSDSLDVKWFATPLGLSALKENKWFSWTDFGDLEVHPVISMAEGSSGWIFAGTAGLGVGRFKCDSGIDGISGASYYNTDWTLLPSDTILSVYVDKNNHQWFGTPHGVAFHSSWETKKEWKVYTVSDGLINNRVQAIMGDGKGKIWFGTPTGVSCFDGTTWKNYTIAEGPESTSVNDIAIAPNGTIWFGTDGGISSFDGKQWKTFKNE